jgi:hypothetical protein
MPAIQFEEQYRAKGLHALILHGDVYCLPNHLFIVPKSSLDCLDKAKIPYHWVERKEDGFHSKKMAEVLPPKASN